VSLNPPSRASGQAVIVLGAYAALRVRQGALDIVHGPQSDKRTLRIDVDDAKPSAILFDSHGEFVTGEALRWCSRYGIVLILPDGPGRILTVLQSALEAVDGQSIADTDPAVIRAQCAADAVGIARDIVRAKIDAEAAHVGKRAPHSADAIAAFLAQLDSADSVPQIVAIEAWAAANYWRAFKDMGLREAKGGNLPRSWLRFANRQKGAGFLGSKHASHPINAMLNYAYVVEAGRLAKALAARGLALPIGFLHADKKGRNSLVWDAIEPLRPAIDERVFTFIASREFARSDFPQTGAHSFRLARPIISAMLSKVCLPEHAVSDAADFMLQMIERHAGGERRLFKADLRRRKFRAARREAEIESSPRAMLR
jgi:CRISPR-associated protein Cas1